MATAVERLRTLVDGGTVQPAAISMWKHFPHTDRNLDRFLKRTSSYQRAGDWDFLKISYNGLYSVEDWGVEIKWPSDESTVGEVTRPAIRDADDWRSLEPNPVDSRALARELTATRGLAKEFSGHVPVIATVFSPLTTAVKMCGEALIEQIADAPDAVHRGLEVITRTTTDFVDELVKIGVDGLFFASQLSTWDRLDLWAYEAFGKTYDLEVLKHAESLWFNIFHVHGAKPMLQELSSYPVVALNWHDRLTGLSLAEARGFTDKILIGGVNEHETLLKGTEDEVRAEIADAVAQVPDGRVILGPGCVVPLTVPEDRLFRLGALRP